MSTYLLMPDSIASRGSKQHRRKPFTSQRCTQAPPVTASSFAPWVFSLLCLCAWLLGLAPTPLPDTLITVAPSFFVGLSWESGQPLRFEARGAVEVVRTVSGGLKATSPICSKQKQEKKGRKNRSEYVRMSTWKRSWVGKGRLG